MMNGNPESSFIDPREVTNTANAPVQEDVGSMKKKYTSTLDRVSAASTNVNLPSPMIPAQM